jgi:hypothetical protein
VCSIVNGLQIVDAHLSPDEAGAMVEGRLAGDRLATVQAHLAVCAQCRAELASVSTLIESAPVIARRRPGRPIVGVAFAAAAAAIICVPLVLRHDSAPSSGRRDQRGLKSLGAIAVVSPGNAVPVDQDSIQFVWHRDDSSTYRIVVTDSAGGQLYTATTIDTVLTPPPTIRLAAGARYFWYVDALRPDGSSVSSSSTSFTVRRR